MMPQIYSIKVKPKSRRPGVSVEPDGTIIVATNRAPSDGAANADVIVRLAEHFGVSQSEIRIVSGQAARRKRVEVG